MLRRLQAVGLTQVAKQQLVQFILGELHVRLKLHPNKKQQLLLISLLHASNGNYPILSNALSFNTMGSVGTLNVLIIASVATTMQLMLTITVHIIYKEL